MADRVAPEWMAYLTSGVSSQKSEPPLPPPVEVKKDTHSQKQASEAANRIQQWGSYLCTGDPVPVPTVSTSSTTRSTSDAAPGGSSGSGSGSGSEIKKGLRALANLQAKFRGDHARKVHVKRAQEGAVVVCPFLACTTVVIDDILSLCPIAKTDTVFDLGSGDGSVLIGVSTKTGATCIGIEIDGLLCATANRKARENNVSELITIIEGDVATGNFTAASVIIIFLVPSCLAVLSPLLKQQCVRGTRIVCYKFPLPRIDGWAPIRTTETDDVVKVGARAALYSYII